ncbi:piezo-type mechanosensitive ion channel component 2 isoform X5 [Megalobrama amblycephala]|uniref:piezo-type mechanosensitive ion channel component 2 isoform X5 n=1 Tax=Megalobrama amblycephala TaxID=75352 RepID=UPI002014689D|nr:piezo-type mechanosensitive ion channel component 2 isoform X5 [Megalobrama amblycephala]
MASEVVCGLIFRVLLPVCLAAACLFRYNVLSFVYLVYLLLIPLFPEPSSITMQGHTGHLLMSLCFCSMSFLFIHIIYQITIHSLLAGNTIDSGFNCSSWEKSIRQIGFESVIGADAGNGIRVFLPDIGMFMASLSVWLLCRKLVHKRPSEEMAQDNHDFEHEEKEEIDEKVEHDDNDHDDDDDDDDDNDDDEMLYDEDFDAEDEAEEEEGDGEGEGVDEEEEEEEEVQESTKMKILRRVAGVANKLKDIIGNLITTAGQVVVTILLGLTGIMLPSLTSAVYFFVFLGLCTWWSLCKTFDKLLFSCLCVLMAIFSAGHLLVLYSNQFQFLQEAIRPNDSYVSVFGISSIIQTDCSSTWKLAVNSGLKWHHFVNPIMLLVLYYTLATLIRLWLQDPMIMQESEEEEIKEGNETAGNSISHILSRKRLLWWKAHQKTEERNVVVVNSNGTSFDYVSAVPIENGPVSLDIYSTPQYKVDQPVESEEKMDENTNEIVDLPLEEEEEKTDEKEEEEEEEEEKGGPPGALVKVFKFIMKQSYICALIAMMAWSITYVSWPTFVFLLWSCSLWMVRDRRKYAMLTSPFMVAYGNLLLVLQYIWCFERLNPVPGFFLKMDIPFTELSSKILCQLSFWLLLRQSLMEKQAKMEEEAALCDVKVDEQKKGGSLESITKEEKDKEEEEGDENDLMHVVGKLVMALMVKYWIYICGGMFFFVSFEEGKMVMYKIIYMMLFLSCVALYQVHYEWWRRILKYFWMSVVVYTMLVLILIYTCQFENAIATWTSMTGIKKEGLKDIGLEKFTVADLFTRIFIPTSFLLVCILHLHYFHEPFLQLTDLKAVISKEESTIYRLVHPDGSLADLTMMSTSPEPLLKEEKEKESMNEVLVVDCVEEEKKKESLSIHSTHLSSQEDIQQISAATDPELPSEQSSDLKNKWHLVLDRLTVLFLKFLEYFHKLKLFIWWLLEMHIIKIVSTYIILLSIKEVSLLNYVFLISWAFALPYKQYRVLASSVCTVWTCVIIVCKMFYQLETIKPSNYSINCTMPHNYTEEKKKYMNQSLLYKGPIDPAKWVGLEKSKPEALLVYLRNNLLMLAILAFEVTIYRHQEFFRLRNKLSPPPSRTIFHDITRQHLDNGIINCVKYFINYFFYKFGLEVCFLLVINVMGQRMDFYSMLHGFALAVVMYRRRRKAIAEIWPKYCCFLACMMTFQYFICIGIPPAACKDYPWRFPSSTTDSNVIKWLYLPDFHTQPNSMFLTYDFMLLLCASLQRQVFDEENKAAVRLMAGDNVEICRDLDAASFSIHNPVPDFIHCRSYLDMLKVIMFSYLFWFVLTIIFITGTTRISIFCMGYLVACFYFLLFGGDLLLKPIKKILRYWDFLIAYNLFVITMKNVFAILACGYIKSLVKNSCWLIQLLSLACTIKEYKGLQELSSDLPKDSSSPKCELPQDEAGIIWDSICFTFLLLQRRVFMSYYFLHVVADIRAGQILASRGAELFQASIVKAVRARLEEEKRSMEQLKRQMDRIKTRQQKFKRGKEKMLSMAQVSGEEQKLIPPDENDENEDDERKKNKVQKKQWWRPWVDHASMVRSGDYYLFETDSEEEEEDDEKKDEEPPKRSAFHRAIRKFASALMALPRSVIKLPKTVLQYLIRAAKFVYHTWITDSKAALKERGKGSRYFWKRYGRRHRKDKKEGHVAIEVGEEERQSSEEEKTDGPDNIIKRVFNIIKFTWVLFLTTVESITKWLNSVCREYIDISTVLRIERCMLTREVKKGNVPSRGSIHVYYQKQIKLSGSRESGLDRISEEDSGSYRARRRRVGHSLDSFASRDSMSSAYTEATMLFSRQSTLDDLDDMPQNIPKTSERARPKLRKMYGLDMSNSSADSGSSVMSSEATQCVTLFSRQGTNDTIDEAEDERDQVEDKKETAEPGHRVSEEADHEEVMLEETAEEVEEEVQWDLVDPEEAVEDVQVPQLESDEHQKEEQCVTEDEEGEQPFQQDESESSGPENVQTDVVSGQLITPDTDAPNTSDADVPPSYSKAVSFDRLSVSDESDSDKRLMVMTPDSRSDLDDPLLPSTTTELTASELLLNKMFYDEELENSESFYKSQPLGLQLCYALYNLLVAHSEMVCYLVIILNHMISASMATLVLPILIFLWAMLSVPRPSKRFWMTAIVYTEVTIVIKYFFQFSFFPFNQNVEFSRTKPYHPPNILGIEKKDGYVLYDLLQLLMLFFHRSILKCHGLWDEDDPKMSQKDACLHEDEPVDEGKMAVEIPAEEEKSFPAYSLKSMNLGMSMDSSQVLMQVRYPEHRPHLRRQSTSGGSHLSRRSSVRSKRGSTSTRNSIRRENSEPEVPQKSRKELIMEKVREQLIKAKVYLLKKLVKIYQPIRQFYYNLIHPEYNAVTDVYVFMFLADTVDFIIIVFGFSAFGKHQGGDITSSLSEDQVPGPFLVMVLIQFSTMVVDRALYLRKTVTGKVIFQVVLVFGIHFWMFFILPAITERRFGQNTIAQLWYFVKCIYFGLSAYQIRCGYPTRILGNFLTKSYNYLNLFLFQGFRLIPFLTELRAVMDWVWTDTTLSLSSWICVEDIYAHIFILKCWRESEKRNPQPRGQKKKKVVKYGMGGMIVMLLICIVWFPLLFMSLVKSVAGVVNSPLDVSITLTLGGLQPIFTMSAQQNHIKNVSEEEFKKFTDVYINDANAMMFLESYTHEDLRIAKLEGSSNSLWTISPPSKENLIKMLNESNFPLTIAWSIQRNLSLGAKAEFATGKHSIDLDKETTDKLKEQLRDDDNTTTEEVPVLIKNIFPRYIRAPSDSNAKPIDQLYHGSAQEKRYMDINVSLHKNSKNSLEGVQEWWIVNQTERGLLTSFTNKNESGLEIYIFSDQVSPPSLGFLAGYGIMGLYMSVVLVIGKFVREFFSGISHTIMFEELPNVNRILKLCTDIFLVRETGELDLEEDLYAKLIFLYRSPETMIKWTREKSE